MSRTNGTRSSSQRRRIGSGIAIELPVERDGEEVVLTVIGYADADGVEIASIRTADGEEWPGDLDAIEREEVLVQLADIYRDLLDADDDRYEALREDRWQAEREIGGAP